MSTFNSGWVAIDDLIVAARDVIANWERGDLAAAVRRLSEALDTFDNPAHRATEIETDAAEDMWESDTVTIDATPLVSRSDDGFWVSACLFVPNEQED